MVERMKRKTEILLICLLCAMAVAVSFIVLFRVTVNGIGLTPDSTIYITAAKNLLEGNRLYVGATPMTHYPPVYSLLLAGSGLFNKDIQTAARWLHALLFGVNAILFMLCIYSGTRRNIVTMAAGGLLYFSSSAVLNAYSYALSEPPFIFFTLLAFLLLSIYFGSNKPVHLILASLTLGLGIGTRYVGIALLPPLIISLLLFGQMPLRKKILTSIWSTALAIIPITAWAIRNVILTRSAANRVLVFHLIDLNRIKSMIDTFHNFILPSFEKRWINALEIGLVGLGIVFLLVVLIRNRSTIHEENRNSRFFIALGTVFSISYILVLFLSISFLDAGTSLDERILLPVFLAMTIAVFATVDLYAVTLRKPAAVPILLLCVAFIIRINTPVMIKNAERMRSNGIGFNTVFWNESPTLSEVSDLPTDAKVYSNGFDVMRIKTWRETLPLPYKYNSASTLLNPDYTLELVTMCREVNEGSALIVYLDEVNWREYFADEKELVEACTPPLLIDTPDGAIYGIED